MEGLFSLDDCGKKVTCFKGNTDDYFDREIVMVIKAPRGEAVIFAERYEVGFGIPTPTGYLLQSQGVRAFVEQHIHDDCGHAGGCPAPVIEYQLPLSILGVERHRHD